MGQTSWGPTGWALFPDAASAEAARRGAEGRFASLGLRFRVVAGRNRPAEIVSLALAADRETRP